MSEARGVERFLGQPVPDLALPSPSGTFSFRQFVGVQPLVLFFYIRNSTPG
jgi:peroxiredoxin